MIRAAVASDRLRVIDMARSFHVASGLPFEFSAALAASLFAASIQGGDRLCLVLDVDGVARGVLAAHAGMHQFAPIKVASEIIWWIDPEFRGRSAMAMLDAYEAWAASRECGAIGMVGLGSEPAPAKLYGRRGYVAAERHFLKSLF